MYEVVAFDFTTNTNNDSEKIEKIVKKSRILLNRRKEDRQHGESYPSKCFAAETTYISACITGNSGAESGGD